MINEKAWLTISAQSIPKVLGGAEVGGSVVLPH